MTSTEDIKNKEVINIFDGRSMGYVSDIEINLEEGTIEGIVIPSPRNFFNIFGRSEEDYVIRWENIKTIGDDVILVNIETLIE
ncbi:PRC-barrel domain-containing protein [Aminipila luticellarii]|uniref:PRC-barrel domain-containing protein n=1 Tax=Aminipila luticellarii TaxID=2507160 RepID=UPI002ED4803E